MKSYDCPNDLQQWGFKCLTGEACGLSLRLLYDLNDQAHELLARTLGLGKHQLILNETWNGGQHSAGSAMLTADNAVMCALFGMLLKDKCVCVLQPYDKHGRLMPVLYGFETEDEHKQFKEMPVLASDRTEFRTHRLSTQPGTGDQHRHMMSGRVR